jgi:hypothetical protein
MKRRIQSPGLVTMQRGRLNGLAEDRQSLLRGAVALMTPARFLDVVHLTARQGEDARLTGVGAVDQP